MSGITFDDAEVTVQVPGYEIYARASGGYLEVSHLGERVTAETMAGLVARLGEIAAEREAKAARARRLKEAETNPTPATMVVGSGLLDVLVRGVHASTGGILITRADGVKSTAPRGALLMRRLNPTERAGFEAALAARQGAAQAVPDAVSASNAVYRLKDHLRRWYDVAKDEWVVEVEGQEFRGGDPHRIDRAVSHYLRAQTWPFQVYAGVISKTPMDGAEGRLFAEEHAAREYAIAVAALDQARALVSELVEQYGFDVRVFTS